MTKNLIAEKLYPWKRCIPVDERSDWELLTYNPDDFFGTSMLFRHRENYSYALGVVAETSGGDRFYTVPVLSDIFLRCGRRRTFGSFWFLTVRKSI